MVAGKARQRRSGEYQFLGRGLLDAGVIIDACLRAESLGVLPQQVLVAGGLIREEAYLEALAASLGLRRFGSGMAESIIVPAGAPIAAPAFGFLEDPPALVIDGMAMRPSRIARIAARAAERGAEVLIADRTALRDAILAERREEIVERAANGFLRRAPHLSAAGRSGLWRPLLAVVPLGLLIGGGLMLPEIVLPIVFGILSLPFAAVSAVRLAALVLALLPASCRSPGTTRPDRDLPVYTLLVPLFREAGVLPDLVRALDQLDYPREKLDIKILLEEVDHETREVAAALHLERPYDVIVVPDCQPRTKPKALNYALPFVRGAFVAVFDAEDIPDPGQLREALGAFARAGDAAACVQARLVIDNEGDGLLARQFAIEYAALFDALLPALDRMGIPIPLSGTSNHFRVEALRRAGAWDAWNVTEDADLGIRLARMGARTTLIGSTTSEEAPFRPGAWMRQRTRWMKGWMQTLIVHLGRPVALVRDIGALGVFGLVAVLGGVVLSALVHPLFAAVLFFEGSLGYSETVLGQALWWVAAANIALGYGASMAVAAVAGARRHGWRMLPHVLLVPFYWMLISLAAYRAIWQLIREPYLWEKTEHGLGRRRR